MQRREVEKNAETRDASALTVGIAVSQFNEDVTGSLLEGAREVLRRWGVKDENVHIMRVYGSFELPFAAQKLMKEKKADAIVALGCIIKGETSHDQHIAEAVFSGLMRISLDHDVPVGLGVLTTNTLEQAQARSRGQSNHGARAAEAALLAALKA